MSAKRLIPDKELKACYGLLFADYPDVVTIRQLQTMLGISRHAAYDLLGEGGIGAPKLGNAYKIYFLKSISSKRTCANLTSYNNHRSGIHHGVCNTSKSVCCSRTTCYYAYTYIS